VGDHRRGISAQSLGGKAVKELWKAKKQMWGERLEEKDWRENFYFSGAGTHELENHQFVNQLRWSMDSRGANRVGTVLSGFRRQGKRYGWRSDIRGALRTSVWQNEEKKGQRGNGRQFSCGGQSVGRHGWDLARLIPHRLEEFSFRN